MLFSFPVYWFVHSKLRILHLSALRIQEGFWFNFFICRHLLDTDILPGLLSM